MFKRTLPINMRNELNRKPAFLQKGGVMMVNGSPIVGFGETACRLTDIALASQNRGPQKKRSSSNFQPSIFRGELMRTVSF